jgi:hypothetical protein
MLVEREVGWRGSAQGAAAIAKPVSRRAQLSPQRVSSDLFERAADFVKAQDQRRDRLLFGLCGGLLPSTIP